MWQVIQANSTWILLGVFAIVMVAMHGGGMHGMHGGGTGRGSAHGDHKHGTTGPTKPEAEIEEAEERPPIDAGHSGHV